MTRSKTLAAGLCAALFGLPLLGLAQTPPPLSPELFSLGHMVQSIGASDPAFVPTLRIEASGEAQGSFLAADGSEDPTCTASWRGRAELALPELSFHEITIEAGACLPPAEGADFAARLAAVRRAQTGPEGIALLDGAGQPLLSLVAGQ